MIPRLKFKIPSLSEEFDYVVYEIIKKYDSYKKKGYSPDIPENKLFLKTVNENIKIELLKREFKSIYKKSDYIRGLKRVKEIKKIWPEISKIFLRLKKDISFKIFKLYEIRLSLYGTGGDYYPSYGAFDGKLRKGPGNTKNKDNSGIILIKINKSVKRNFSEIIIHEAVHLGIEKSIVKKHKLIHWEKEALVDYLCLKYFKKLIPNYKAQKDMSSINKILKRIRDK